MTANSSYLSSSKYGYDFVVATTQASINSGLKEYLNTINQPSTTLCFLADSKGNPNTPITLDALKAKTEGIDPFSIPDGTQYSDSRITTLTENKFMVGLKLKLGLPPGIMPKDLPTIVELGSSANNVGFNLLCSEFEIIQNTPPGGFASEGSWNVWSQASGKAWYFSTKVNLVYSDLNKELDTPYFNNHPDEKEALLQQLKNLGSGAFSLQQLLFDLDNAAVQSFPKIEGLDPGSNAGLVLTRSFVDTYFESAKTHGEPLLSVHAVANTSDGSSLRLTGMEREVGQFVDGNGVVVKNPTPQQEQVVTLDYLCAANNNPLPGTASFNWNWVDPANVGNESGIIAINRNTLANYYKNLLIPHVKKSCLKAWASVTAHMMGAVEHRWKLTPGQTPTIAKVTPNGSTVLTISYESQANAHDKSGLTYAELDLHTPYTCSVLFSGNTITIVQNLKIYLKVQWDLTHTSGNIVDRTITDTYTLSVGQNGLLNVKGSSITKDDAQKIDLSGIITWFVSLNDLIDAVKAYSDHVVATSFSHFPVADIQNFVFPGAKVFTYKNVQFSEHQDLLTAITYVKPS